MEQADIKRALGKMVTYGGHDYIFDGCRLRKGDNGLYYMAELLDTQSNSLLICPLNDVEMKEAT